MSGRAIYNFIKKHVNTAESELITDEFQAYLTIGKEMKHQIINHQEQYAEGEKHTNTIEGFWSLLKRAWYGSHHHYKEAYTPLYVAERCYVYNYRNLETIFWKFIKDSMSE